MEYNWEPLPDETPEDYVERVGGWEKAAISAFKKLMSHYGFDQREAQKIFHGSQSYWERFFLEHAQGIFNRGGSRYAALRFIQRKNEPFAGKQIFSQQEIDSLIDSVGRWKR